MVRILRTQKSGYAVGLILILLGFGAFSLTVWHVWPSVSSAEDPAVAFWNSIWREKLDLVPSLDVLWAYLVIFAAAALVSGLSVLVLSRQWLPLASKSAMFQCPFCRKRWRTASDKALVHCPFCRQLVHPKLVDK